MMRVEGFQIDANRPSFIPWKLQHNRLFDETEWLQWGQMYHSHFWTHRVEPVAPSNLNQWPTKDEKKLRYKYSSVYLELLQDKIVIERQTYSTLDWLGDVGGLYEMLILIGAFFMYPISQFSLSAAILVKNFRLIPKGIR